MTRYIFALCIAIGLIFSVSAEAAVKIDVFRKWLPFTDDIIKLGKKAPQAPKSQVDEIVKRFPSLAGRNPELVRGVIAIEKAAQNNPAAGKMLESGLNPARVAIMAERHPEQLKLGNEISEMFAKLKPQTLPANLPSQAAGALRRVDGNYVKAGESFMEMAARGGKAAVDVADKLYKIATSPRTYAAAAAGLLAWHMADPEGAEQAVQEFFSEHAVPLVTAPLEGIIKGGGKSADESLAALEEQGTKIWDNHWKLISGAGAIILFVLCLFFMPNLRKLIFAAPDSLFGRLLDKVEYRRRKPDKGGENGKRDSRINIYGRRK